MNKYNILEWQQYFEKIDNKVDEKKDFLDSKKVVLYPGRFYVLNYISKKKDRYNARPVMLSLGISVKKPDCFLCIDLSVIPKKIRLQFIDIYFKVFYDDIMKQMDEHPFVDDADDQEQLKFCTYQNLCKLIPHFPFKAALKRYIIKNTRKIYSVPFTGVYKIIGDYCDENFYQNGTIKDVQNEFIKKLRTHKG